MWQILFLLFLCLAFVWGLKRQILSREEGRGACFCAFSCCGNWIESLFDDRDEGLNFRFFPLAAFAVKRFFLIEMRDGAFSVFSYHRDLGFYLDRIEI